MGILNKNGIGGAGLKLLISDHPLKKHPSGPEYEYVDLSRLNISNCIGCFGCWVRTPGRCVIRDDATKVYPLIAASTHLIYVTRIRFGSYDIPMKTMLERAIPIQKAFIRLHNGETHHMQRNVAEKDAVIIAYGEIPPEEQEIFRRLVARNANNMLFQRWRVVFTAQSDLEAAVQREVRAWGE